MKNITLKFFTGAALVLIFTVTFSSCSSKQPSAPSQPSAPAKTSETSQPSITPQTSQILPPISRYPISHFSERITKKPFGIKITPSDSPVQPEKFSGYHTGTDFETFPEELNTDVEIFAICDGELIAKRFASGYGGMIVQTCTINNSDVTVVYGHLRLTSIAAEIGDTLNKNNSIGLLGNAYSSETDGERKHLHLSIHKGKEINILGYVQTQKELEGWINFEDVI